MEQNSIKYEYVRFRCDQKFKTRLRQLAGKYQIGLSKLIRLIVEKEYANEFK